MADETVHELVAAGRSALRRGNPAAARSAYGRALEIEVSGTVLAGLAEAAYLEHDHDAAIDAFERAYSAFRDSDDPTGAARIAGTLGYMHGMIRGDRAVMGGWIARAQTLLEGTEETADAGWVEQFKGMFAGEAATRELHFRAALELARRHGARDLELDALAYLGATLVHDDRVDEGMVHLDEALAGVSGREVDDFLVLAEVFCQLFSACEHAHDVGRADEWIRVGESIAARRQIPDVSAFCRTHYGGLLTAAGRWPEADVAFTDAVRLWSIGPKGQRGAALIRLADLRVRQGRFEEAEQLLSGVDRESADAAPTVAALHHLRGEDELAADVVERALTDIGRTCVSAAPLLSLLVDLHLAAGDIEAAREIAVQLHTCAELHGRPHLLATAALAQGRVCLASGEGDALACLHTALSGLRARPAPVRGGAGAARARCRAGRRPARGGDGRSASGPRGLRGAGRHPARATRPPPCSGASVPAPPAPVRAGPCSASAKPRCSSSSATGCRTRRSPSGSTSAARPSSTTSATSSRSSGCAAGPKPRPTPSATNRPPNRGPPRSRSGRRGPWSSP